MTSKAERAIYVFSDLMSKWGSAAAIVGTSIGASLVGLALGSPAAFINVLNLTISNVTQAIGLAVLVSAKRESAAVQLKLDKSLENDAKILAILEGHPVFRDAAIGSEHGDVGEIEGQLQEVETRAGA